MELPWSLLPGLAQGSDFFYFGCLDICSHVLTSSQSYDMLLSSYDVAIECVTDYNYSVADISYGYDRSTFVAFST